MLQGLCHTKSFKKLVTHIKYSNIDYYVHLHTFTYTGKKRKQCGQCSACSRENCGQCSSCKDMPKFGGPGRKKQCCELRRCLATTINHLNTKEHVSDT